MVNTNIQSPIPLSGRGHTYRKNGGYTAGEYKQLVNAELNDLGYIVSRRNIDLCGKNTKPATVTPVTNPMRFIGNLGDGAVLMSRTEQRIVYGNPAKADHVWWSPTSIDTDPTGNYNSICKFLRYNKKNYWITSFQDASNYGFRVYSHAATTEESISNTVPSLAATVQEPKSTTPLEEMNYKNAFIHKERLWIVGGGALYFSKATDPSVFSVPDGGFFKFAEADINYALSLQDSIYVICDSAIYIINYSADPNLDANVIKLDGSTGGDWACVHQGNVYFSKDDSLNVISNLNVDKVMNLNLGFRGEEKNYTKILSFGDYLVLQRYTKEYTYNGGTEAYWHPVSLARYTDNQPSCYFINMELGSIHALDFSDFRPSTTPGYVSDAFLVPREDANNNTYLYLLTKQPYAGGYQGNCYVMPLTKPDLRYDGSGTYFPANDTIVTITGKVERVNHHVRIEVDSFVPDGTEYNMKKFRSLLVSAKFPRGDRTILNQDPFKLYLSYENQPFGEGIPIYEDMVGGDSDKRPPFPHRFPLNQRGRSISIKFELVPDYDDFTTIAQDMLIEDMRLFWTYTAYVPTKRSADSVLGLS